MSDQQIHVVAVLNARPEQLDQMIHVLAKLAASSREEPGCIEYTFIQDTADPNLILADETWTDSAALEAHFLTPHFLAAVEQLETLLAEPPAIHQCKKII